jgi:hypothetical protein
MLAGKPTENFRPRRKAALIGITVCVVLLAFCVTAIMMNVRGNRGTTSGQDLSEAFSPRAIPPEEFFLPDEPDFLPEMILERERRKSWTTEDAQPFWTDPLDEGTLDYTELMSKGIDGLMERVP